MGDLLPDPTNLIGGLEYIDREAKSGHFSERSDLDVFRYLWINCWHKTEHKGEPVVLGLVLESKAPVAEISAVTMLGERSINRSLTRLAEQKWIFCEQTRYVSENGPGWKHINEISVLMDPTGHRERDKARQPALTSDRS